METIISKEFRIQTKDGRITGYYLPNGKVRVNRGSFVRNFETNSLRQNVRELRNYLSNSGYISNDELKKDFVFDNPSIALSTLLGRMVNGNAEFITLDNVELGVYLNSMEIESEAQDDLNKKIVFFNIAYMKEYKGITFDDIPYNGGEYVRKTGDALEKYNFLPLENGKTRGFVETKHKGGYESAESIPNQLHIENIDPDYKDADYIDGVVVIFCASPKNGGKVIVGWYEDATVYRTRKINEYNIEGLEYNIEAESSNAHLIPEGDRTFNIPSIKEGSFGFGQSNIRYVRNEEDKQFADTVIDYFKNIKARQKQIEQAEIEEIAEFTELSDTEKKAIVKQRIGQSLFRQKLLDRDGRCRICGLENKNLLVASHIKAWSDCNNGNERIDINNGLTLCSIHDGLFDNYLISFDDNGAIIINHDLSEKDREILNLDSSFKLAMSKEMRSYMKYHRKKYDKFNVYVQHNAFGIGKILNVETNGNYNIQFDGEEEPRIISPNAFEKGLIRKI